VSRSTVSEFALEQASEAAMIGIFVVAAAAIVSWLVAELRNARPAIRVVIGVVAVLLSVVAGYSWCRAALQFRIDAPNRLLERLSAANEEGRQGDVNAALRLYRSQMSGNRVNAAVSAIDALQRTTR
jgi:hypothetical protein